MLDEPEEVLAKGRVHALGADGVACGGDGDYAFEAAIVGIGETEYSKNSGRSASRARFGVCNAWSTNNATARRS